MSASIAERMDAHNPSRPGYRTTEIGVLPDDWALIEMRDLEPFVTSGSRGWARYYSDVGAPFVRITNVSRGRIYLDLADLKLVRLPPGLSEVERTEIKDGDVLISITADIGIVGYVDARLPKPAYINQHLALVRLDSTQTDSRFVSYFLASEGPQRLFRGLTDQGAKAGMSLLTIRKLKLAHPGIEQQRAIAAALSDVDAWIDALDKLIAKKRAMKLATMQQLLTGKTRLPGWGSTTLQSSEIGPLPSDWQVKRLGELFEITSSKRVFQSQWKQQGVPFYRARELAVLGEAGTVDNDLFISRLTYEQFKNAYDVPRIGDMLVTGVGTLGKTYVVSNDHEFYFKDGNIIWFRTSGKVDADFLKQLYQTPVITRQIMEGAAGTTVGTYTIQNAKNTVIPFPLLAEQRAIASVLQEMDAEVAAVQRRREKAKAIKQGMGQALLTGRVHLVKSEACA